MKKLRSSVEEDRRHDEIFCTKVPTYNDRFKTDLCDVLAAFLTQLLDATQQLMKSRDLTIKKSVDANFAVVDDTSEALESEMSLLGPNLSSVDQK